MTVPRNYTVVQHGSHYSEIRHVKKSNLSIFLFAFLVNSNKNPAKNRVFSYRLLTGFKLLLYLFMLAEYYNNLCLLSQHILSQKIAAYLHAVYGHGLNAALYMVRILHIN